jgi:hypothetical protein
MPDQNEFHRFFPRDLACLVVRDVFTGTSRRALALGISFTLVSGHCKYVNSENRIICIVLFVLAAEDIDDRARSRGADFFHHGPMNQKGWESFQHPS